MTTFSETLITPSRIKLMIPSGVTFAIGDDFFIARMQEKPQFSYLRYPFRVDCYMAAYCVEGTVNCSVNLTDYQLTSGTLLLITPGNIVKITDSGSHEKDLKLTIICASTSFISGIGINPSKFLIEAMDVLRDPCIHLSDDDIYDEKFPEERDPHGDETVDLEKAAEVEIDEFDNLNTDENIYGGEDEL